MLALWSLFLLEVGAADPFLNKAKPYSQDFFDNYNILKYTGWEGPYSQRRGVGLNRDTPAGCRVDQVAMLHRHGERYPDSYDAGPEYWVWSNMTSGHAPFTGELEFLNWWTPISNADNSWNGVETTFGAYSGLFGAYSNGVDYRRRYNHLFNGEVLPFFTSGYERIVNTARKFGQGFLGFNYTDLAAFNIVSEDETSGANTIATGYCDAGIDTPTQCKMPSQDDLDNFVNGWYPEELSNAAKRLNHFHDLNLTASDVHYLMATAAFELNIRGNSPWIEVFTSEEWIAFEYYESSYYYCYYGPESAATKYRGSVYLNATRTLLNQGPEETLPLIFTFAHDTDITPVVTLLGFVNVTDFDPTKVHFGLPWDVTDIVPQSAHLVFERLIYEEPEYLSDKAWLESEFANTYPVAYNYSSNATYGNSTTNTSAVYAANYTYPVGSNQSSPHWYGNLSSNSTTSNTSDATYTTGKENIYVRVILNDAVVPLPNCSSGPGKSCKLSEFNELVDKAIEGINYFEKCIQPKYPDAPQYVDFYWNWNATNAYDYDGTIPYQAGLVDWQGEPET